MKKVLIVSYLFAPVNSMASKRFSSMCGHMGKYGYQPFVLTVNPPRKLPRSFAYGAALDLRTDLDESFIIRCGTWADQRVSSYPVSLLTDYLTRSHIVLRCLDRESFCWLETCKKAFAEGKFNKAGRPDLVVGTYPSAANLYVAEYLARQWKVPFVMDIRDLISQYQETPEGTRHLRGLDVLLEKYFFRRAAGVVTVTRGFAEILGREHRIKATVVYNGWEEAPSPAEDFTPKGDRYLYYAGSLYGHRMASLSMLAGALMRVRETVPLKLMIRTTGPEELVEEARRMLQECGAGEAVILKGGCGEETVKEEQKRAFINVVLSDLQKKRYLQATVPGKLIELLPAPQPILAVTARESEIAKILKRTGKGETAQTKEEIVGFLRKCLETDGYKGNQKAVRFFRREWQAKRLCGYMDTILK